MTLERPIALAPAKRALDLIETAAILEPRDLKDSGGEPVTAPSAAASGADGAF